MIARTVGTVCVSIVMGCAIGPPSFDNAGDTDVGIVALVVHITSIDNKIPVDGGLFIYAQTVKGQRTVFGVGSLYTRPPPSPETLALYQKLRPLLVGDWVEVSGQGTLRSDERGDLLAIEIAEIVKVDRAK